MRDRKLAALPVLVIFGLLVTGVAFAHWSESLYISGSVATADLDWKFTLATAEDDQLNELDWNCGDNFVPMPWRVDKDVGMTTAEIKDPPENHTVEVTLCNVYPCYWTSVSVYAKNTGTIPLHFEKVLIDSVEITGGIPKVRLDLNSDGKNDIEIWWKNNIGVQLHPGDDSPEMSFWVHVLQDAPMDATLSFTIQLVAVQYNESIHPLPKPTISLSPTSLTFSAVQGGANPAPQTVTITNSGPLGSTLNWSATDDAAWLSLSPTSGSLASGASQPMTVSVDISGLGPGTYSATITVSDPNATNSPQTVGVTLVVTPAAVTVYLHPNAGSDATDYFPVSLTPDNLAKLAASDDSRYRSLYAWWYEYSDYDYIDFELENIPAGVTVNSVVLKFEWQRPSTVDNARLRIWDGSSWSPYYYLFPLPTPDTDAIVTLDLKAAYGIDTAAEVNALRIRFQATDGSGAYTWHDWIEVEVNYTP